MGDNEPKPLGGDDTNKNSSGSDGAAEAYDEESPLPGVDDDATPEQVRRDWRRARQRAGEAEEAATDDLVGPVDSPTNGTVRLTGEHVPTSDQRTRGSRSNAGTGPEATNDPASDRLPSGADGGRKALHALKRMIDEHTARQWRRSLSPSATDSESTRGYLIQLKLLESSALVLERMLDMSPADLDRLAEETDRRFGGATSPLDLEFDLLRSRISSDHYLAEVLALEADAPHPTEYLSEVEGELAEQRERGGSWIRRFVAVILGKGWVFPVSLTVAVAVGLVAAWLVFFNNGGDSVQQPLGAAGDQSQPVESEGSQDGPSATDEVGDQTSDAGAIDASGSASSPEGRIEVAPSEPTAKFLAEGRTLDGLLTVVSVQKDQTYEGAFILTTQLPLNASQDEAESYRETVRRAVEKIDIVTEILESAVVVLSQQAPDGLQNTFGLGVTLQDDSTRFVTVGGDGFLELFVLQPEPDAGFPTDSQEVVFSGWTLGWGTSVDTDELIEAALKGFSPEDPFVTDAFWAETISGSLTALGPELIVNLETGIFPDGKMGVKVDLGQPDPFADAIYVKTVGITVRDDSGGFYSGSFGSVGGVLGASGFCGLGDNCPSDGTWPGFNAALDGAGVIVVSFDPLDGSLTVAAEVSVDDDPDPDSRAYTSNYLNGQRVPFGTSALNY